MEIGKEEDGEDERGRREREKCVGGSIDRIGKGGIESSSKVDRGLEGGEAVDTVRLQG